MLSRLLQAPSVHEGHLNIALRLLLNLSFSAVLQSQMATAGIIPCLVCPSLHSPSLLWKGVKIGGRGGGGGRGKEKLRKVDML